ncbi:MAG: acyl-CoA dehydrogenase [Myxococcota bacterium]
MDLSLDESQQILVDTFAELLEQECPVSLVRECEKTGFSEALWSQYREMGANVMGLPESVDGLGMGLLELGLVAQRSGRVLAPVPFVETAVAGRLLAAIAPGDPLLARIAAGEAIVSLALPRPHAVTGTGSGRTGRALVPFGAVADAVVGIDAEGLFVAEDAGKRRGPRLRDAGSGALAWWSLQRGEGAAPRALATGDEARRAMARASAEWKLLTGFWLVGLAQRALEIGADYARERIQFGVPIGGFQAIAHPLAECAIRVDGAELLAQEAAWAEAEEPDRFEGLCSMAFAWAAQTALRTADVSLHTHGGYGFSEEYDIQLYYRRAAAVPGVAGGAREELQRVAELCLAPERAALGGA